MFVLEAKDHTVSNKNFQVWECKNCTVRFTQDVPSSENIGMYYQSSAYISHSNTNKGFINRLYHAVRNITLKTKKNLVEKVTGKTKGNLLDIGAGTGAFASVMLKSGWQVTALEPDETARANAQHDFNISLLPAEKLFGLKQNSFDAVTLWHVLEHVHDLHDYLNTFFSILKPDGVLIIAVPNYNSYDAKKYGNNWAAYDVPRHLYHFNAAAMKALLEKHKFKITDYKPMWFDSYYVSLLSEKYATGKSRFIHAFINASASNFEALKNHKKCSSVIYIAKKQFGIVSAN